MRPLFASLLLLAAACGTTNAPSTGPEPGPAPTAESPSTAEPAPAGEGAKIVPGEDPCRTDADCAPAACCHASSCVAAAKKPACGDVMCTMECRPGTIDCGGGCLCQDGRCAARLMPSP